MSLMASKNYPLWQLRETPAGLGPWSLENRPCKGHEKAQDVNPHAGGPEVAPDRRWPSWTFLFDCIVF